MATNGYKVNYANKEILLTKSFVQKAQDAASEEYKALASLYRDFPGFEFKNREAKKTSKNTHKGLDVERMEKYINTLDKKEDALAELKRVREYYGKSVPDPKNPDGTILKVPYGKLKSWFLKKYPDYEKVNLTVSSAA